MRTILSFGLALAVAVPTPLQAGGVSLNGPDTLCRAYLRHAEMNPELLTSPEFSRGFLRRFRSVIPRSNFRKIESALDKTDAPDTMVISFIGGPEVLRGAQLLHPEYLEADHANHREAKGKFQNIVFASTMAASLLIWAALKIRGFNLDTHVSQFLQFSGMGLMSVLASTVAANAVFGPSYATFIQRIYDSMFHPERAALYYGHTISGTDRPSQYHLDILFSHSEVPAMVQRDILADQPADTPVMVVVIRPK